MVDALLVFSPLQEISFFVVRTPYFDRIGVAPLLRRRLFGLQRLFSLLVFPSTSPRFVFCSFACCSFYLTATFTTRWPSSLLLPFSESSNSCQASYAASLRTYLLSFLSLRFLIRKNFRKTSSAVAYSVSLFFILTKN